MAFKGQKLNKYSKDFKLKVVLERFDGTPLNALCKKDNIPNNSKTIIKK